MTHYGLNPSFCRWTSRLPLFADMVKRGRCFEVFEADGTPTGEESNLIKNGWPDLSDGRWHGVRIFGDMGGTMPAVRIGDALNGVYSDLGGQDADCKILQNGRNALTLIWRGRDRRPTVRDTVASTFGGFHLPSIQALRSFRPRALRTLDWQMTNVRRDWSKPDVGRLDPLQGTNQGMAIDLQVRAANLCESSLWWCAPPRFELSVNEYETWLERQLARIRAGAKRPPILEYGNELWNDKFSVHGWLKQQAQTATIGSQTTFTWHQAAAEEIALLKRVADRVFGEPGILGQRPYYLFVGGHLAVPSHLNKILGDLASVHDITPDLAGPALYVGPLKEQRLEWEATGAVPTQEELRDSCFARLADIEFYASGQVPAADRVGVLRAHRNIVAGHGVPYFACYEAGQALLAGAHPWRAAAIEAQRTEWMGDLYRAMRGALERCGVDLACWYSAATNQEPSDPRVDVFGLLESCEVDDVLPKAKAARGE